MIRPRFAAGFCQRREWRGRAAASTGSPFRNGTISSPYIRGTHQVPEAGNWRGVPDWTSIRTQGRIYRRGLRPCFLRSIMCSVLSVNDCVRCEPGDVGVGTLCRCERGAAADWYFMALIRAAASPVAGRQTWRAAGVRRGVVEARQDTSPQRWRSRLRPGRWVNDV